MPSRKIGQKSWFRRILLLFLIAACVANGQAKDLQEEAMRSSKKSRLLGVFTEKFDGLPPSGKFATSAVAGFVGSRVTLRSFVSAAKIAGATFIA